MYICVFTIYISLIIVDMTSHDQPSHHLEGDEAPVVAPTSASCDAAHGRAHGGAHGRALGGACGEAPIVHGIQNHQVTCCIDIIVIMGLVHGHVILA